MIDDNNSTDVTHRICAALTQAMAEGALNPGMKILDDVIAGHFGVSRTVARGAIAILERERLIDRKRNRGAFVAAPTISEAEYLLEARRIVECAIVDRAVGTLSDQEMDRLEALTVEEDAIHAGSDNKAIRRNSGNFHLELARAAGNMVLHDILQNLMARLSLVAALYESRSVSCCGSNEHRAILAAIRDGDRPAAQNLMLEHLQGIEASLDLEGGRDDKNSLSAVLAKFAPAG